MAATGVQQKPSTGLEAVREQLAAHRAAGEPFERAWAEVVERLPPGQRDLLWFGAAAWRDAYLGHPGKPCHAVGRLLAALADDESESERSTLPG
jgi:hypothetical protein